MEKWYSRTELLLGNEKTILLQNAHVMVVGIGGVGGMAAEMLCRAGIGEMTIIDADTVSVTNLNRQIISLNDNVGKIKAECWAERLKKINPALRLNVFAAYMNEENMLNFFEGKKIDFVADAIDTIAPKIALIEHCIKNNIPIISSMGSGAKTDITKICLTDIAKTYNCRLAKTVRQRLAKDGFRHLPVVFSSELPDKNAIISVENEKNKKSTTGTISYMPAAFGCFMSAYIIKRLSSDD